MKNSIVHRLVTTEVIIGSMTNGEHIPHVKQSRVF